MIGIDTTLLLDAELRDSEGHEQALQFLQSHRATAGLALCPQVLSEFLHIVTDARRFSSPLNMENAVDRANRWWNARQIRQILPSVDSTLLHLRWMKEHRLGRKRILDTQLAATYFAAGIRKIATANPDDFAVFGGFELFHHR